MWLFCGEPISQREPEKLAMNDLFLHNQSKNLDSASDIDFAQWQRGRWRKSNAKPAEAQRPFGPTVTVFTCVHS